LIKARGTRQEAPRGRSRTKNCKFCSAQGDIFEAKGIRHKALHGETKAKNRKFRSAYLTGARQEAVRKILVATTNQGKIAELSAMFGEVGEVQWLSLKDFPNTAEVEEDGESFAENAAKKALGYSKATGLWTIADDSGLVVDALDGAPGVRSARFSGSKQEGADRTLIDYKNMEKVLELMMGVPAEKRSARFVCHICLADGEKILAEAEGTLEGFIAEKPAGENGFGYDPIMYIPELGKTVAQISAEQKNQISHRGKAVRELIEKLKRLL